jgi:hypothetical protein
MSGGIEMKSVGLDPLQPIVLRLDFGMEGKKRHIGLTTLFCQGGFNRGDRLVGVPKAICKGHDMFIHWG